MTTDRRFLPSQRIRDAVLRSPFGPTAPDPDSTSLGVPRREADLPLQPSTWSVRAAMTGLFSFELLFFLFVFAGRLKANSYLAWIPVDMTALFFASSVIVGAFIAVTKKVNRHGLVIAGAMGAFVTWLIVSLLWTPGVIYAHQKVLYSVLAFWACAGAAVIIASDRARVRRFLTLVLLLAVWFAIEGTFAYATAEKSGTWRSTEPLQRAQRHGWSRRGDRGRHLDQRASIRRLQVWHGGAPCGVLFRSFGRRQAAAFGRPDGRASGDGCHGLPAGTGRYRVQALSARRLRDAPGCRHRRRRRLGERQVVHAGRV